MLNLSDFKQTSNRSLSSAVMSQPHFSAGIRSFPEMVSISFCGQQFFPEMLR